MFTKRSRGTFGPQPDCSCLGLSEAGPAGGGLKNPQFWGVARGEGAFDVGSTERSVAEIFSPQIQPAQKDPAKQMWGSSPLLSRIFKKFSWPIYCFFFFELEKLLKFHIYLYENDLIGNNLIKIKNNLEVIFLTNYI